MTIMRNLTAMVAVAGIFSLYAIAWVDEPTTVKQKPETIAQQQEATPPLSACFAPGTSQEYIDQIYEEINYDPTISLYRLGARWGSTVVSGGGLQQGDPTVITWSIVPDGTFIPGSAGEPSGPSNMIAWMNSLYPGGQAEWFPIFETIFTRWSELSGTEYIFESNDDGAPFPGSAGQAGVRGDVRIAAHFIDGNSNILAYNFFPDTGDMVIDSGDNFYNNQTSNSLGLRNVLTHEHGHGMGFSHVCPVQQSKLMEPFVSFAFDGPQHDDILAVNRGYGDRFEHNDTTGTATSMGALGLGNHGMDTVSLDGISDQDYFSFEISTDALLSMTLTPIGFNYLEGPQLGGGACSPGSPFDSQILSNPAFQILNASGDVLATADANPAGQTETVTEVDLPEAGTYYVRVFPSAGANDDVQLYEFDLTLEEATIPCNYGNMLEAWNADVESCRGTFITILDILDAIGSGKVTPY